VSVLYCAIPYFSAAVARRDCAGLGEAPLVLVGPEGRVVGVSAEAAACGVGPGMTARAAEVRCPQARLWEADVARCRKELETLFESLERASPTVEPHGWGAAYVDLGDLARGQDDAVALCGQIGQAVRRDLGGALDPALGWDSTKFTAQAAARHTRPGRLRAVAAARERDFLRPLSVEMLPLEAETVQALQFLGLRTLGQYAALPPAAVWQQFGRAGKLAQRCARGEDDRPVIPRWQAMRRQGAVEFESPLVEQARLITALRYLVAPMVDELVGGLQACGQIRLTAQFDDGPAREKERTFSPPAANEGRILQALEGLLEGMGEGQVPTPVPPGAGADGLARRPASQGDPPGRDRTGIVALSVALEQIEDAAPEQLTLFPMCNECESKIQEVQRYLATRFGANRLRRAVLAQPGAPLPEWRVSWQDGGEP
jgi:nucleotidyltransferase/DNA polymerase involved in DNA repair